MFLYILTFSFAFFILAFQKDPNTLCAQGPLQGLKRLYRKNSLIFLHFFFFFFVYSFSIKSENTQKSAGAEWNQLLQNSNSDLAINIMYKSI